MTDTNGNALEPGAEYEVRLGRLKRLASIRIDLDTNDLYALFEGLDRAQRVDEIDPATEWFRLGQVAESALEASGASRSA